MGVRRAVDMVLDASNVENGNVYTYGPLIHNPQVLKILAEKNIHVLNSIPQKGNGTVLIRAHGVPPDEKRGLIESGFNVIDATCPRVIKVQKIIQKYSKQGYSTIIIGDKNHPEVKGLLGYAMPDGYSVANLEEFKKLNIFEKAILVAQTTQNKDIFELISDYINNTFPNYKIFNTICDSTSKRQEEVKQISKSVDAVVVVGGYNSGNTQRLAEIVHAQNITGYHIETDDDIDSEKISNAKAIGITAGASTPNWIIRRVYNAIESISKQKKGNLKNIFFTMHQLLMLTNIFVAIGAFCLSYTCMVLTGIQPVLKLAFMAFLYVLSMHTLNHLISRKSEMYNYPNRAAFYQKNKILLTIMAFSAGFCGLIIAFYHGIITLIIILSMSILGLSYKLVIIPEIFIKKTKYRSLQDIPGSKTILISLAWGIVTTILPYIAITGKFLPSTFIVFLWSSCLVFVRTAFFEIIDMQGDRIIGRETIPLLLGEKQTIKLLKYILLFIIFLSFISYLIGFTDILSLIMNICVVYIALVLIANEKNLMFQSIRSEFLIESNFILSGLITFCYYYIK